MNFYKPIPKLRLISIISLVLLLFCNVIIIGKTSRSIKLCETEDPTDEDCRSKNYKQYLCIKSLEAFLSVPRYENHDFLIPKIDSAEDINEDIVFSITIDQSANILVTGSIYQEVTGSDVYLSKFSDNGTLLWSEFLGGNQKDYGTDVAVDSQANIIIVGQTTSEDFNTTADAFKESRIGNDYEVFITKFSSSRSILWSTYLGGSRNEKGICSLDIDSQDNVVVVGRTESFDFPTLNAMDSTLNGESDIFIAKFNSSGSLLWSTYLGGTSDEYYIYPLSLYLDYIDINEIDVTIDDEDNVIVTSTTTSEDFPVKNAQYTDHNGDEDLFISKFNSSGSLIWSTFLGGEYKEYSHSIAVDSSNDIIVTGKTLSNNFPIKAASQSNYAGSGDLFVTKFSSSGVLKWSTFLGGLKDDISQAVSVDNQDNVLITGRTKSDDFPGRKNTNSTYSGGDVWGDAFLSKISSSGSLMWSTYLGGSGADDGVELAVDNRNEIILSGNTESTDFPTLNTYKYSFGGSIDGFLTKFDSSGGKIWSTRAVVVTEPDTDQDMDNLSNLEEFHFGLDPLNPDTDNDIMEDGEEVSVGLDPHTDDAYEDNDNDGIINILELGFLDPLDRDTDSDLMPDGWEIDMHLDPTLNDSYDDSDSDGLPNIWEYQNNLNASDLDAEDDIDNDGLTNLEEYQYGINDSQALDPRDPDTDNDGLPDGWEVNHGLNPLDPADANADPDKDYFPNKLEYQLGFSPQSPHELYGVLILIFLIISLIPIFFLRTRKLNQEAVLLGFVNNKDKKAALKAGFNSAQERSKAKNNGFLTAGIYNIVKAAGWFNVGEMVSDWLVELPAIKLELKDEFIQDTTRLILESSSPVHLSEIESELEPLFDKIDNYKRRVTQISSLQQSLISDYQLNKIPSLIGLALDELKANYNGSSSLYQYLTDSETNLKAKIIKQREFFTPWPQLLTLIQLTEDRAPVKLSEIAKIVNCSEEQAEHLIVLLLQEDESIGKYDNVNKIYTKGRDVDVIIQSYIKEVRKIIDDLEKR